MDVNNEQDWCRAKQTCEQQGYVKIPQWLPVQQVAQLRPVIDEFHHNWCRANLEFYQSRAVNSAYLTGPEHLSAAARQKLFNFLASAHTSKLATAFNGDEVMFVGTQLFFNPCRPEQQNYWHRDCQYHMNLEQQRQALSGFDPLHFRLALAPEPGVELIPGSHKQWDTPEQLDVRLQQNGASASDDLAQGVSIELEAGDVLVFSANMIHRGLYGLDRFALDMLFCPALEEFAKFVADECLPTESAMAQMEDDRAFRQTIKLKTRYKATAARRN